MTEWTSIEDRLPEKDEYVLVCREVADDLAIGVWDGVDWYTNHPGFTTGEAITHWMPLPYPPKVVETRCTKKDSNQNKNNV